MWFKNLKTFRLAPEFALSADELEERLAKQGYQPIGTHEMHSLGWVEPRAGYGLVHAQNGQYLLCLRSAKKLLPASVINLAAKARAGEIEEQRGFKPGRKQMKEIKEQITDELLPKAFTTQTETRVWIDTAHHWMVIDASTSTKSDEVLGMLAKAVAPLPVSPLYVQQSPSAAMTYWLADDDAPDGFTVDQDSELRSTGESGAAVRYVRQSIDIQTVKKHVAEGKQVTKLALTWNDRISFVLTDALDIKRVTPLDVLRESSDAYQNDDERFASDFALMTGELAQMLAHLVESLGGERSA